MRLHIAKQRDEVLRKSAEADLERARKRSDPESARAVEVLEETLGVLRRSKTILEGIADGVYVTGPSGRIRLWNESANRLTGLNSGKALGRMCKDILGLKADGGPLDCSNGCALIAMSRGARKVELETERDSGGGHTQHLLVTASVVDDASGKIAEVVHSIRDITATKHADEAKTMFLATASHELKTPLTVILGFAQILLEDVDDDDEERQIALKAIEKRALELTRIVDRLLLTGRIEAGRVALSLNVVDTGPIVVERAQSLAAATERRIAWQIPDNGPAVFADADAMATVLDHLIDNAVKYSPDGEDVSIVVRAAPGSRVEIAVSDLGVGMTPNEARHCFDRFWQAELSDVRRFGGTGIGLYIVRSLVESMGGSIEVRSMPGQGSTFTMRFRRATDQELPKVLAPAAEAGVGKRTMIEEFMHQIGASGGKGQ